MKSPETFSEIRHGRREEKLCGEIKIWRQKKGNEDESTVGTWLF